MTFEETPLLFPSSTCFLGEVYHPYHFNCVNCKVELNSEAREKNGDLYCLRCHDKVGFRNEECLGAGLARIKSPAQKSPGFIREIFWDFLK